MEQPFYRLVPNFYKFGTWLQISVPLKALMTQAGISPSSRAAFGSSCGCPPPSAVLCLWENIQMGPGNLCSFRIILGKKEGRGYS